MVARRVEPAPFVDGVVAAFTVLDDPARVLQADDGPSGHVPTGQSAPGPRWAPTWGQSTLWPGGDRAGRSLLTFGALVVPWAGDRQ